MSWLCSSGKTVGVCAKYALCLKAMHTLRAGIRWKVGTSLPDYEILISAASRPPRKPTPLRTSSSSRGAWRHCNGPRRFRSRSCLMLDLILIAVGLGFFALSVAYVYACDRL